MTALDGSSAFVENVSFDGLRAASEPFANAGWPSNLEWINPYRIEVQQEQHQDQGQDAPVNTKAEEAFPLLLQTAADACVRARDEGAEVVRLEEANQELNVSGTVVRVPRNRAGLFKPTDVSFTIGNAGEMDAGGTVVLAIRGSKTWMDWMVNFHDEMVDAEALTVC